MALQIPEPPPNATAASPDRVCPWSESAFDATVFRHLESLHRVATHIVGCEHLARDAVQETLLALWRQQEVPIRLGSWLREAVTLRSLHAARTQRRRRARETDAATVDVDVAPPWESLARDDVRHQVAREIDELTPSFRRVLRLRDIEGLDYRTVALRLRVPVGTVRSRLSRARMELGRRLAGLAEELGCARHSSGTCRNPR